MSERIIADSPEEERERQTSLRVLLAVRRAQTVTRRLRDEHRAAGDERGATLQGAYCFGANLASRQALHEIHYGVTWRRNHRRRQKRVAA